MENNIKFLMQLKTDIEERINKETRQIEEEKFTKLLAKMSYYNAAGSDYIIERAQRDNTSSSLRGQAYGMVKSGFTLQELNDLTVNHLVGEADYLSLRTRILANDNKDALNA